MSLSKLILAVFSTILLKKSLVLTQDFAPRKFGLTVCNQEDYPFVVTVVSTRICAGSLVTLQWVLTAAHCLEEIQDVTTAVRAGHNSNPDLIQVRFMEKAFVHDKYNAELKSMNGEVRYDIGLLLVNNPFVSSPFVKTVKLPKPGYTKECRSVRIVTANEASGNATVNSTKNLTWRHINCFDTQIHDMEICSERLPSATTDGRIICTVDVGNYTCLGPSGGPLMCGDIIIGITLFGSNDCHGQTKPALYTKVEKFLSFISKVVKSTGKFEELNERSDLTPQTGKGCLRESIWIISLVAVVFFI